MDPKSLLRDYTEVVLNQHELARLDEFTTADQLKKAATGLVSAFPDLHVDLEFVICEGDVVGCHARGSGTHTGTAIRGIEAAGRAWTATCNAFFRVEGGTIADAWTLWDWASILKQIGPDQG